MSTVPAATPLIAPEADQVQEVWIATGFSVRAASCADAESQAAAWMAAVLAAADSPSNQNITVTSPAQGLHSAAVLALQLMALEKEDGEILGHVHRLRAQLASGTEAG